MSILGTRVSRIEDSKFLTTGGIYTADLIEDELAGAAHLTFVRSPMAHGRIRGIDSSAARTAPGVIAVVTVDDLGLAGAAVPHVQPEDAAPGVGRPGRSVRR